MKYDEILTQIDDNQKEVWRLTQELAKAKANHWVLRDLLIAEDQEEWVARHAERLGGKQFDTYCIAFPGDIYICWVWQEVQWYGEGCRGRSPEEVVEKVKAYRAKFPPIEPPA